MSPLIEYQLYTTTPKIIGDFPDESGTYMTTEGEIKIDFSELNKTHELIVEGEFLKGRPRHSGGPGYGPTTRRCQISKKKNSGSIMIDMDTKITFKLHNPSNK